jgi:hypothetical protein
VFHGGGQGDQQSRSHQSVRWVLLGKSLHYYLLITNTSSVPITVLTIVIIVFFFIQLLLLILLVFEVSKMMP